jgi:hypothetical protein
MLQKAFIDVADPPVQDQRQRGTCFRINFAPPGRRSDGSSFSRSEPREPPAERYGALTYVNEVCGRYVWAERRRNFGKEPSGRIDIVEGTLAKGFGCLGAISVLRDLSLF